MSQKLWNPPNVTFDSENLLQNPPSNSHTSFDDGEGIPLNSYISSDPEYDSDAEMVDRRAPMHRPTDGKSVQPLLPKDDIERGRPGYDGSPATGSAPPLFNRRSTLRSRSPDTQAKLAAKQKYTYAAFFLALSLVSFTVQTETAVFIQHKLKWNKAYCML